MADKKLEERNIPGMMNRSARFAEVGTPKTQGLL